jgi:hypothetical protein
MAASREVILIAPWTLLIYAPLDQTTLLETPQAFREDIC